MADELVRRGTETGIVKALGVIQNSTLDWCLAEPYKFDASVRRMFHIPSDRYYTVAVWPESVAGTVRLNGLSRSVAACKISKSDNQ